MACCPSLPTLALFCYREGPHTLVSQPACPSSVYSLPKQLVFGLRVHMLAVMIFPRKMDLGKRLVPGNGVKNVSGAQSRKGGRLEANKSLWPRGLLRLAGGGPERGSPKFGIPLAWV